MPSSVGFVTARKRFNSKGKPITSQRFILDGGEGSFATYRAMVSDVLDAERQPGDKRPYTADVIATQHDVFFAHSGAHTAARFTRGAAKLKSDGLDDIAVMRLTKGRGSAEISGLRVELAAGTVLFMDRAKPVALDLEDCHLDLFNIPRALFEENLPHSGTVHGALSDRRAGRHLDMALAALAGSMAAHDIDAALEGAVAGMAMQVHCEANPSQVGAARLAETLRCAVHARLDDPDLSANSLAAHLGMSRASLYRACAGSGGVAAYIRHRRLEEAARLLRTQPWRRITDVAQSVGFENFSHFSSAFGSAFGASPRAFRTLDTHGLDARKRLITWRHKSRAAADLQEPARQSL